MARYQFTCAHCGKTFATKWATARFCSRDCGNASRVTPLAERFWRHVDKSESCWLWTRARVWNGYGRIAVNRQNIRTHRLAWILTHGPIADDACVLHNCPEGDNRLCCNPAHLWLGDRTANADDRETKGRTLRGPALAVHQRRGAQNHNARLTDDLVRVIRADYASGAATAVSLAHRYGVTKATVLAAIHHRTWAHV